MADAVTSQTILDGERLFIAKFTNISDGTGETGVTKIDVSTLNPNSFGLACNGVKINKIYSTTHGMEVRILWDATTDQLAWQLPQNTNYLMDFSSFGGIPNNAGAGKTGNLLFSTADASSGDMYTIVLECLKTYASA
ncbi:MAG: hypothetical protein ACKO0Z_24180 [Betaproteobacteria bacterium]